VFFHEVIHGLIVLEGLEQSIVLRIGKGAVFVATDHAIFLSQQAAQATTPIDKYVSIGVYIKQPL